MVMSTGTTWPRMLSVAALYCLQNSMVCTPCGPRAVPTGGAGVAEPASSWILTMASTFFLGGIWVSPYFDLCASSIFVHGRRRRRAGGPGRVRWLALELGHLAELQLD